MGRSQHTHWEGGPVCRFPTKKVCDEAYANWQAEQQVLLAERVVAEGRASAFKGESVFDQLVQVVSGKRQEITNRDGVASSAPFTRRVVAALDARRKE